MRLTELNHYFETMLAPITALGPRIYRTLQEEEQTNGDRHALEYPAAVFRVLPGASGEEFEGTSFSLSVEVSIRGNDPQVLDQICESALIIFNRDKDKITSISSPSDIVYELAQSVFVPGRVFTVTLR